MQATAAADCAQALFTHWIARHWVPETLTSDRGAQFTSALWDAVCGLLNIRHNTTTAYHPEANGMVERLHRRLKDALRARGAAENWPAHLPWVLLGLRSTTPEDGSPAPDQAVFGSSLILPGQFVSNSELSIADFLKQMSGILRSAESTVARHNTASGRVAPETLPAGLLSAPTVFVRRDGHVPPLTPLYDGPFTVLRRSAQFFKIRIGTREETVSTSRLKPCSDPDAAVAQPRRRGRPPTQPRVHFNLRAQPPHASTPDRPAAQLSRPCIWLHLSAPDATGQPLAPPATPSATPGPGTVFPQEHYQVFVCPEASELPPSG